jgi:hypothetical protein
LDSVDSRSVGSTEYSVYIVFVYFNNKLVALLFLKCCTRTTSSTNNHHIIRRRRSRDRLLPRHPPHSRWVRGSNAPIILLPPQCP